MNYRPSLACIPLVVAFCGSAHGQEVAFVAAELSSPHEEYLLGESVPLELEIRNTIGREIEGCRTSDRFIGLIVTRKGEKREVIDIREGWIGAVGGTSGKLAPAKCWTYHLRAFQQCRSEVVDGAPICDSLAFPEPGDYTIQVRFPLSAAVVGDEGIINRRNIASNTIHVSVVSPTGDDERVFEAISDPQTREFIRTRLFPAQGMSMAVKLARLIEDHPKSGYRNCLKDTLIDFAHRYPLHPGTSEAEVVRLAAGLPDLRFFPDDPRLEANISLNLPDGLPVRLVLEFIKKQSELSLSASPHFMQNQVQRKMFKWERSIRETMLALSDDLRFSGMVRDPTLSVKLWVRRGEGYFLYTETLNESPAARKGFIDQIGPLPAPFPKDRRLAVKVVADFPELTSIDKVLASYSKQTGITLEASPFLHRCRQSGDRMTLDLGEEMGYLARTFAAEWKPRGDGYYLDAGAEADRDELPPKAIRPPEVKESRGTFGGLAVPGIAGLFFLSLAWWGWARSRRGAPRPAASTSAKA